MGERLDRARVGDRYVDVGGSLTVQVVFVGPAGDLVVEEYRAPCEVPQDRQPRSFPSERAFWRAYGDLVYLDREADLDHVRARLLAR